MNQHRGFEIYNTVGKEITYQELNVEAAEFWGVPVEVEESYHMFNSVRPPGKFFHDLYFGIIEPIQGCDEGLVDYKELVGKNIGYMSDEIQINPRSYKMLIDKLAPYIKLIRH